MSFEFITENNPTIKANFKREFVGGNIPLELSFWIGKVHAPKSSLNLRTIHCPLLA